MLCKNRRALKRNLDQGKSIIDFSRGSLAKVEYLFSRGFLRHQTDDHGDDEGYSSHDAVVVEVVDPGNDGGPGVVIATGWGRVDDVENHTDNAESNPNSEAPECALRRRKA